MFRITLFTLLIILGIGCIGDDFVFDTVDPVLRIDNQVDTLAINTSYQFETTYLNNIGVEEEVPVTWSSVDESILTINSNGLAQALAVGSTLVTAQVDLDSLFIEAVTEVNVGQNTIQTMEPEVKSGTIQTTTFYLLEGDFEIRQDGSDLILDIFDNYRASASLPGLYLYLTNNPNTTANALEVGAVEVFTGAHSYTIPNVDINEYSHLLYFCKPFSVKVGDGEIGE